MTKAHEARPPMAIVDGGDEPWERLNGVLRAQLAQLPPGGVLELLLRDRHTAAHAAAWCRERGHLVLEQRVRSTGYRMRVTKGASPSSGA